MTNVSKAQSVAVAVWRMSLCLDLLATLWVAASPVLLALQAKEVGEQVKDKATQAAPSDSPLTKLFSKPEQAASSAADKASSAAAGQAGSAAAEKVQEAAPSDNPLSKLLSKPQQAAGKATDKASSAADKAQEAAPSTSPFSKLFTKPQQLASGAADKAKSSAPSATSAKGFASKQSSKAKEAAKDAVPSSNPLSGLLAKPEDATNAAKAAAPAGNPLTNLFNSPSQPEEATKEAAASSNPLSGLLTKPQQATQAASSKAKQAAKPAASKASGGSNPFSGLLSKPKQAADKGQSAAKQAGTGAAVAGAASGKVLVTLCLDTKKTLSRQGGLRPFPRPPLNVKPSACIDTHCCQPTMAGNLVLNSSYNCQQSVSAIIDRAYAPGLQHVITFNIFTDNIVKEWLTIGLNMQSCIRLTGSCVAAAAAAANAIKSNATGSGFETSLPSIPDASEAVQSATDAASKLSLPEAPTLASSGTGIQQVVVFLNHTESLCGAYQKLQQSIVPVGAQQTRCAC